MREVKTKVFSGSIQDSNGGIMYTPLTPNVSIRRTDSGGPNITHRFDSYLNPQRLRFQVGEYVLRRERMNSRSSEVTEWVVRPEWNRLINSLCLQTKVQWDKS